MAKKKGFISYDYDNDKHYKNLLLAWDKNSDFDFSFNDESVDVSVDSNRRDVIRRVISSRLNNSDRFLCIVDEKTYKSGWVKWEIEKSVELKKKIVDVKTAKDNETPTALYGVGASWALSFNFDAIKKALEY